MKYIGPFFRMNSISKSHIKKQLFFFSKEAVKHIVLESKCGILTSLKDLKIKTLHNIDINTLKPFSPLLCIYKKANCGLFNKENSAEWNEQKFKKIIPIRANAYMILCLLEMVEVYRSFKDIEPLNYHMSFFYMALARKQLEFLTSNFRNEYGLFVDKNDMTNPLAGEYTFKETDKSYNFSDQALLMAAHYRYYQLSDDKDRDYFKNYAMEILNMFFEYKDEVYSIGFSELMQLCLSLNLFYKWSQEPKVKLLLTDAADLLLENYKEHMLYKNDHKTEYHCLMFVNSMLIYSNTGIYKFKELCSEIESKLSELYKPELGIFLKDSEKKEIDFYCDEILLYLIVMLNKSSLLDSDLKENLFISDIFRNQVINSGIIPSWPELPNIDSAERYMNFSRKSEDFLEEINFKMPSVPTAENAESAPVFLKYTVYNRKKQSFSTPKNTFDANRNMFLFFMIIYFFKDPEN